MNTYSDEEEGYDYGSDDADDYVYGSEELEVDDVDDYEIVTGNFAVLTVEELEKRQNKDVCSVSSVLSVSREVAILLLIRFNWDTGAAEEEWFTEGERIRKSIGLVMDPVVSKLFKFNDDDDDIVFCRICLEDFSNDQMTAAACGHVFCYTCWNSYISISINDGPGCLTLGCPDPLCSVAIGEDMMKKLMSKDDEKKYSKYLIRSFVENSKKRLKWCPSPDCDYAIEYESGSESFDVKCGCSYSFCWNCLEEIHRPVDCETVANWNAKNKNESENTNWLLVNSKPCPKCKNPIEKNLGCMHMTCKCRHEFCWLCMGTWAKHTSDFYTCNKYEKARQEGKFTEQEKRRIAAKNCLDKYVHFYERWAANEDSRKKSLVHLEQLQSENLQKISDVQQVSITNVEYITKAWQQIIECRRLLKWAYAYGYYIADEERAKKQFFEFTQGEAEVALERLHQCAENEVLQYADAVGPLPGFGNLQEKLCRLTRVTKDYFEHLVRALENGLADVSSKDECITDLADCNQLQNFQEWMCLRCTFYNSFDKQECDACFHPRPDT